MVKLYEKSWFFSLILIQLLCVAAEGLGSAIHKPESKVLFTENLGQWDNKEVFRADFRGGRAFLMKDQLNYVFYESDSSHNHPHLSEKSLIRLHTIRCRFVNANAQLIEGTDKTSSYSNFFLGNNPSRWKSDVYSYKNVIYRNIYAKTDLKLYSQSTNIKYEFIVKPGGNTEAITLEYEGAEDISIRNGQLVMKTSVGEIIEQKPFAYQVIRGKIHVVHCNFVLNGNKVSFIFPKGYDKNSELVIDPTLVFSTFSGSFSDNWGMTASYDREGNTYSGGIVFGPGLPTTPGAFQTYFAGGGSGGDNTGYIRVDMALLKFSPDGKSLLFSTYLGGNDNEQPQSIIVNSKNELLVYGRCFSNDYPVKKAYDSTYNGNGDIVVSKLSSDGKQLLGSTYIGGSQMDGVNISPFEGVRGSLKFNYCDDARGEVLFDSANNVIFASSTQSSDFPVTSNSFQKTNRGKQDACVLKLSEDLGQLLFASYLGGAENDAAYALALDKNENLYVCGGTESTDFPVTSNAFHKTYMGGAADGFVCRISSSGNQLMESSFIGTDAYDQTFFVQTDPSGNVYLLGQSQGNYPVSGGVYSNPNSGQFIQKLNPSLSTGLLSTVFGTGKGTPDISPAAFMVDKCGNIYASGWGGILGIPGFNYNFPESTTNGLPVTNDAFQPTTDGSDFYFIAFKKDLSDLWYATFFGGPQTQEHVDGGTSRFDKSGVIYQSVCGGCGALSDMPTTPGVWSNTNNSNNCNNAVIKFKFDLFNTIADFSYNMDPFSGCTPVNVAFTNKSIKAESYKWDFGDGSTSQQINPIHTYKKAGKYKVRLVAINFNNCNIYDTAYSTIVIKQGFKLIPQPDQSICPNGSVQLKAVPDTIGNFTYSWNPSAYLSDAGIKDPQASPSSSTSYTVTASNWVCTATDTIEVKVLQGPGSVFTDKQRIVCKGDSVLLDAGAGFNSVSWSTGDNTSSIWAKSPGTYKITTTLSNCSSTDSITVTKGTPVNLNLITDTTICKGQSVQLYADGGTSIHWVPALYLNNDTLSQPICTPSDSISYLVTVKNGECSAQGKVQVNVAEEKAAISTKTSQICEGETLTLDAGKHTTYLWSTGAKTPTINVSQPGLYKVITSLNQVCYDSSEVTISVTPKIISVLTPDTAICEGQPLRLKVAGGKQYLWKPSAAVSDSTIANPNFTGKKTTTLSLKIIKDACALDTTVFIQVHPAPAVKAGKDTTVLLGQTAFLNAKGDPGYYWLSPIPLSCYDCAKPSLQPDSTFSYVVIAENAYGCRKSDTMTVFVDYPAILYIPNCFTANKDGLNEVFRPKIIGIVQLEVVIFNRWGEKIYEWHELDGGWDGTLNGSPAQEDTYVYVLKATSIHHKKISKSGIVTLVR